MLEKINQVKIHIYVEYIFFTHWKNSKPSNEPRAMTYLLIICTTSDQRLRRWSNIAQMLYKC